MSQNLVPNESNFSVDRFAPDLSKLYSLQHSYHEAVDEHLRQRKACTRLSHVREKGKEANVLIIWLMMWILTFEYLDEDEKKFRIEQILGTMHKLLMKYKIEEKELIMQDVFETVLEHGTFKMVEELYEYLNLWEIKGNAMLDNIFFNAIRKHNEILDLMKKNNHRSSQNSKSSTYHSKKGVEEWKFPQIEPNDLNATL